VRRIILALVVGMLAGAPVAGVVVTLGESTASATATPTPTPGTGAASIGVTIGSAGSSGGGAGGSGGHHGGGGSGSSPGTPGPPTKPAVPSSPTPTNYRLILNHATFRPGQTLIATGTRFTPGEKVQFVLYPGASPVKSFVANSSGTVKGTFVLSARTASGAHTIEATGWQSKGVASADYSVVSFAGAGGASPWLIWLIGGLAVAGAIALVFAVVLGWLPRRPPALVPGG
jgi:hypothetical protein